MMLKDKITRGQKHYTATVFIISEDKPRKFLLTYHKKFDKWMPPGGHIEEMENPLEAAIREVEEETGVNIEPFLEKADTIDDRAKSLPMPTFFLEEKIDAYGDQPEHYHLDFVYVVEFKRQDIKQIDSGLYQAAWFDQEEMEKLAMLANVRDEIKTILAKLGD